MRDSERFCLEGSVQEQDLGTLRTVDHRSEIGGGILPLRLLHISDIHFHDPGGAWDDDADQQRELVEDIKRQVADGGAIDAILIGGDIAFGAKLEEYLKAENWIEQLRNVAGGLGPERVWTVPGNHDVDRSVVESSAIATDFRDAVFQCDLAAIDFVLKKRLQQDPAAEGLFASFDGYNHFASQFGCQTSPRQPHWRDNTLQFDGLRLRLTGINSAMASYRHDSPDEGLQRLVVGTQQSQLSRERNVVDLVLMHHPPAWIRDWNVIEANLRRAHLWVFGHEHSFAARQSMTGGTVEIFAGAVSPERTSKGEETPYLPSFDIITLRRTEDERLEVIVDPRLWDRQRTRFDLHGDGIGTFYVDIDDPNFSAVSVGPPRELLGTNESDELRADGVPVTQRAEPDGKPSLASPLVADVADVADAAEVTSTATGYGAERIDLRRLGINFIALPRTDKLLLARELGVFSDSDLSTPELQIDVLILTRIREKRLTHRLRSVLEEQRKK